jgi:hypothetical protein
MTEADYVAIAVSPALVMALVGSLVFFLIEVLYVGNYEGRLNYVFALFVFATVLIARIAIEFGSERAAMFSLPLGILTFLALMRFVQHPGPFSWLINLVLLAVVWWCAHNLTWDCTLIDDNEDASGEGLLGQVGLDSMDIGEGASSNAAGNELFADGGKSAPDKPSWWSRLIGASKGPHTPGLRVLYFSLAALPLFGIGQHWIPPTDVGRRRYAFGLLAVYVAAALCLLVTTSFLGLRRYLRQRRVEMPAPMAATWVSLGAVLILLVMFTAALIPRPGAEYSISQAPWQAGSPDVNSSTRYSVGNEGTNDPTATDRVTSDNQDAPLGNDTGGKQDSSVTGESADETLSEKGAEGKSKQSSATKPSDSPSDSSDIDGNPQQRPSSDQSEADADAKRDQAQSEDTAPAEQPAGDADESVAENAADQNASAAGESSMRKMFDHTDVSSPAQLVQALSSSLGNILKLLFYVAIAAFVCYFAWKRRGAIARAFAEMLQQLREFLARLFGRGAAVGSEQDSVSTSGPRRRTFAEFSDPFSTGRHRNIPPVELVRYTFEAFEAWAGDRGRPRTPDQTPQELVRGALAPQTPMYAQARQLVQLYSEAAYASATITREAASSLQPLWHLMRSSTSSTRRVSGEDE